MPIHYAVIPAAGEGKRIKPYSVKVPKPMIQVFGKPILAYVLERCKKAGIKKIIIIVGPQSSPLKDYFGDGTDWELSIDYVVQPHPEGIGHAVGLIEGNVKTPFAVYLGDELYLDSNHKGFIGSYNHNMCSAAIGLIRVDDENLIKRNYSVDIESETNFVKHLIEKPTVITNNILGCGSYIFDDIVFEAIRQTPKSSKNEIEITDALNTIIKMEHRVCGYFLGGTYLNITYPKDIIQAEQLLQKQKQTS
jgi:dTDP-glucose pyrophosphorylase